MSIPRVNAMLCVPCKSIVNVVGVNVVGDGCPVHQSLVTHLTAAEDKLAEMQKNLAPKKL